MKHKTRYRTIWLSDIHLGTKDCRVEPLLEFLSSFECDHLYFVGDVIDVWSLRRKWYWPTSHNHVVRKIIKRDVKGTQITFIPGNHDEVFRDYDGMTFGGVSVHKQAIHTCADGKRLLVLHGDEFDAVVTNAKLITAVGDWLYYVLLWINRGLNQVRRLFRRPYWSLAGYIKNKVKSALQFVNNYEGYVARAAREAGVQGVICGHIHRPEVRMIGDILYCNCGDWVENCTAIVEHDDGRIELLDLKHPAAIANPRARRPLLSQYLIRLYSHWGIHELSCAYPASSCPRHEASDALRRVQRASSLWSNRKVFAQSGFPPHAFAGAGSARE